MEAADALPRDLALQGKFQLLTRVGFVARGLLYGLIAILVLGTGQTEDLPGALDYVGHGPGLLLLVIIAAGMAAYGLWRLADAAFGMESRGDGRKAYGQRIAAGFIGCVYVLLAVKATRVVMGGHAGSGGEREADALLKLPGGTAMLVIAALIMLCTALVQIHKASRCAFLRRLGPAANQPTVKWLGRIGYGSRGVIFAAVAYLLFKAAIDQDASDAGGMEQALDMLHGPVEYAVAMGLMLFGAFSLIEARYRRIQKPPMEEIKQELREKVGT